MAHLRLRVNIAFVGGEGGGEGASGSNPHKTLYAKKCARSGHPLCKKVFVGSPVKKTLYAKMFQEADTLTQKSFSTFLFYKFSPDPCAHIT